MTLSSMQTSSGLMRKCFFPRRYMLILPFRIFLAWLNLEFGIESCFIEGLSAFWSSWLQFIFPLYIWTITGVIIFVCRHSTRLTKTFGDRALPLLATLFLMSYLKLLHTVVYHTVHPSESKIVVWYIDGNLPILPYLPTFCCCSNPYACLHAIYTGLISIQWPRRYSH